MEKRFSRTAIYACATRQKHRPSLRSTPRSAAGISTSIIGKLTEWQKAGLQLLWSGFRSPLFRKEDDCDQLNPSDDPYQRKDWRSLYHPTLIRLNLHSPILRAEQSYSLGSLHQPCRHFLRHFTRQCHFNSYSNAFWLPYQSVAIGPPYFHCRSAANDINNDGAVLVVLRHDAIIRQWNTLIGSRSSSFCTGSVVSVKPSTGWVYTTTGPWRWSSATEYPSCKPCQIMVTRMTQFMAYKSSSPNYPLQRYCLLSGCQALWYQWQWAGGRTGDTDIWIP